MLWLIVPQSLLCSWVPFQGDGVGDDICDGELSDFKCWWQDGTLRRIRETYVSVSNPNDKRKTWFDLDISPTGPKCLVVTGELHLQSAASGHSLVCIQGGAQLFAEELADSLFNGGDSGGRTHNLHCIDILLFQLWMQEDGDERDTNRLVKVYRITASSNCW